MPRGLIQCVLCPAEGTHMRDKGELLRGPFGTLGTGVMNKFGIVRASNVEKPLPKSDFLYSHGGGGCTVCAMCRKEVLGRTGEPLIGGAWSERADAPCTYSEFTWTVLGPHFSNCVQGRGQAVR